MTREAVKRRGVMLVVNCPDGAGWVVGDAVRIKQTMFHVLSGALKHVTGDRIELSVQRGASDGISNDITFAVRHATSEGYGPGLGVYLAQRMVELHGGRLEITTDGGDTVVACRLPAGGLPGRVPAAARP